MAGFPSNLARDAVEANARSGWSSSIRQSRLFDFEADVTNLVGRIGQLYHHSCFSRAAADRCDVRFCDCQRQLWSSSNVAEVSTALHCSTTDTG